MIIHNMKQRTPEWVAVRDLKMSASHASTIAANGKGLKTYITELCQKHYLTIPEESYTNAAMQNGIDLEESALFLYSMKTGIETIQVGFVEYNDYVGVSPDSFAGDLGVVEVKCPSSKVYFQLLLDDKIDPKYYAQMQMQIWVCEKDYADYCVYCPSFSKKLIVKRVYPDEIFLDKLKSGIETGTNLIKEITEKMDSILIEPN